MADKHHLPLEVLREYGVDLTIPHEAEFDIIGESLDSQALTKFATQQGFEYERIALGDDCQLATLRKRVVLNEQHVRPLSEMVEGFCREHGWDYSGWGASSSR